MFLVKLSTECEKQIFLVIVALDQCKQMQPNKILTMKWLLNPIPIEHGGLGLNRQTVNTRH
jgi:hypothetical protein